MFPDKVVWPVLVGMGEGYSELTVIIHILFGAASEKPTSFVVFVVTRKPECKRTPQ